MKKKGFCLSSFLLFIVFAVSACGKIPDFAGIQTQSGFTPNPDGGANAKIDILFVIDNSGTMQPDQQVLADSFGSFISAFADRNLQYHIGVISTDTCRLVTPPTFCIDQWNVTGTDPNNPTSTSQYKYGGIFNNGIGGLLTRYDVDGVFYPNGQSVVSPSDPLKFLAWDVDPDPVVAKALTISRFTNNALIGTTGSGSEAPLSTIVAAIDRNAAYNGTDNQLDVNYNNGFFRSSAFTAIFIVTDEDEGYGYAGTPTIVGAAGDYLSGSIVETSSLQLESNDTGGSASTAAADERIEQFLSSLESLKGSNLDNFVLSVVAVPATATSCAAETAEKFEPALVLNRVVDDINNNYGSLGSGKPKARFASICSDFSSDLTSLASDIVEANARYALDQLPDFGAGPITVTVNGTAVSESASNGWQYDSVNNVIQFYGSAVPGASDSVSISYTPL